MSAGAPAPVIVSALFAPADAAWLDDLRRRHFPPERNHLPAHLTLFHHLPPAIVPELAGRLRRAAAAPAPAARIAAPCSLGGGTALRVESEGLAAIRADLAEAFAGLLVPQDQAGWRAHVTIQNKVTADAARALLRDMAATWTPRPLGLAGLAAWYYRGGPWERIAAFPFRGGTRR